MLFLRATCYHISTCVTFGVHGNHSPVLMVYWGTRADLGLPQCLAQAQHADISTVTSAPSSLTSTRTGRCNAPCSHIPHFYLRVSIIHSSVWRWVEIGATSQGPPLPTSTLHWSATFPLPLIGLFIRAFAYLILTLTDLGPMTGPKILKEKRINSSVFHHCAVSSLLSKVMKAEALAGLNEQGSLGTGAKYKTNTQKATGVSI